MPVVKYCLKCREIEQQKLKWRTSASNFEIETKFKLERLYFRENRKFIGIAWYCPNCHNIKWDKEIEITKPHKTVMNHPSISYRAH